MFWHRPRPAPEFPISHDEVMEIIAALSDIKSWTLDILAILTAEDEDEQ
jgi:hypothetical protein